MTTMNNSSEGRDLLWKERQRNDKAQRRASRHALLKRFTFAIGWIVLTLAVAAILAHIRPGGRL